MSVECSGIVLLPYNQNYCQRFVSRSASPYKIYSTYAWLKCCLLYLAHVGLSLYSVPVSPKPRSSYGLHLPTIHPNFPIFRAKWYRFQMGLTREIGNDSPIRMLHLPITINCSDPFSPLSKFVHGNNGPQCACKETSHSVWFLMFFPLCHSYLPNKEDRPPDSLTTELR